jgi:hypothetical protein
MLRHRGHAAESWPEPVTAVLQAFCRQRGSHAWTI